jgi:hypothetical protein
MFEIKPAEKTLAKDVVDLEENQIFFYHGVDEEGNEQPPIDYAALTWSSGRITLATREDFGDPEWNLIYRKTLENRRPISTVVKNDVVLEFVDEEDSTSEEA